MSKQVMLVNVHEDETRIALTKDKVLVGLHMEQTHRERTVGNIYRGTVVKVNPSFQAAFVDYGEDRNGFLSLSDVNLSLFGGGGAAKGRPRIQSVLREGQTVMVQVLKEGLKNKGSALTTFVSLPGRYMVCSPKSERSGVSRKIEDMETRRRLKDILEALQAGEDMGMIIRTAGIDKPIAELKRDLDALRKMWRGIQDKFNAMKKPGLVYQESGPIVRVLRDFFSPDVSEVWVDDPEGFQEALKYFKSTLPKFQKRLKLYVGDTSLFSAYHLEGQIEELDSSKVSLASGGSIVLESTEALVTVDVNSGRSSRGSDIEETALHTNLEAAREIARQLRLRNLGGLIVIDFIDMMSPKNRSKVEKVITESLQDDKARCTIGTISQFGLLEMSRQRVDMETTRGLRVQCPTCDGTGHIPTVNASANNVLRKIRELAATGKYSEIYGDIPLDCANMLLNDKREALRDLELEFDIILTLKVDPDLPMGHMIKLSGHGMAEQESEPESEKEEMQVQNGEADSSVEASEGRRRRRRRRRRRGGEEYPGEEMHAAPGEPAEEEYVERQGGYTSLDEFEDEVEEVEVEEDEESADYQAEPERPVPAPRMEKAAERPAMERPPVERPAQKAMERPAMERPAQKAMERPAQKASPQQPAAGANKGIIFQSFHEITDSSALEKLPVQKKRTSPFDGLKEKSGENTILFQSSNLEKDLTAVEEKKAPAGKAEPKKDGAAKDGKKEAPAGKAEKSAASREPKTPAGKPAARTGAKAASKSAAKDKPAAKPAAETAAKTTVKTSAKTSAKPAGKTAAKTAGKTAGKTAAITAGKTAAQNSG